jgi:pyrimidine operon attenuation protein/uracil phosphoribosyltransferase
MQTYLVSRGVPVIRAAVLADRCCAVLPVKADIVGVHLQVAPSDVVECNVPPYEETFKIEVLRPEVPGRH